LLGILDGLIRINNKIQLIKFNIISQNKILKYIRTFLKKYLSMSNAL